MSKVCIKNSKVHLGTTHTTFEHIHRKICISLTFIFFVWFTISLNCDVISLNETSPGLWIFPSVHEPHYSQWEKTGGFFCLFFSFGEAFSYLSCLHIDNIALMTFPLYSPLHLCIRQLWHELLTNYNREYQPNRSHSSLALFRLCGRIHSTNPYYDPKLKGNNLNRQIYSWTADWKMNFYH